MSLSTLINRLLEPIGIKIHRIEFNKGTKEFQNRYDTQSEDIDSLSRDERKVINLLDYTKQNNISYNAAKFDAGYHEIQLGKYTLTGQRKPRQRLELAPYDFSGKTVLDIGCNQGGMLHALACDIKQGIGLDYDSKMINVANRIKSLKNTGNVQFYVFDLEKESLDLIDNFLPDTVDIVFLLSVCMWIENWRDVIRKASTISNFMLFESNGTNEQQQEQYEMLVKTYDMIQLLQDSSPDDPGQKNRKLYFCSS